MSSCSGMYQNQPFVDRRLDDHRGAFVAAGVAIRAFPVGPDGAFVEHRIPDAQAQPVRISSRSGRWHRRRPWRATSLRVAVLALDLHADGPVVLEEHVEHARAFVDVDAVLAGVVEHHLVELAAHDLPGLRALVRLVVPEVERRGQLAVRVDELHAVLLDEVALLHLRQHVQPLEHPVGLRNQRFADVKARETLALEELDAIAALGDQRGHRRSGRTAADDDDVRDRGWSAFDASCLDSLLNDERRAFISNRGRRPESTTCTGTFKPERLAQLVATAAWPMRRAVDVRASRPRSRPTASAWRRARLDGRPELDDFAEPTDDRFDRRGIDVDAADGHHVVGAGQDAALEARPGPSARARHRIAGRPCRPCGSGSPGWPCGRDS